MKKKKRSGSELEHSVVDFLEYFGENPSREGLVETPKRVVKMYRELLGGYGVDVKSLFKIFKSNGYDDLVTVTNIDFYSLCEHHIIPFYGKVHIGYVPNDKILGLSKFARIVEAFSHRLQTQENLTRQIADSIEKNLKPKGLIVYSEAEHLCINMRGVRKKGLLTKTVVKKGLLVKKPGLLDQFYRDISKEGKHK